MKYNEEDLVIQYFDGKQMHTVEGFADESVRLRTKSREKGSMTMSKDHIQYSEVIKLAQVGSVVKYGDKQYLLTECSEDDTGFNGKFEEI